MTVKTLIEILSTLPPDCDVTYAWDGEVRSDVTHVWVSRNRNVVLSDGDVIYSTENRPEEAPTEQESPHWRPK